ncbi:MAG: putative transposase [Candidatus Azotimanducaceae bacterium]|jgi:putative transposase
MRSIPIFNDTFYHVYNRGDQKQKLFLEKSDYVRFLFLLLHLQSPELVTRTERRVGDFLKRGTFKIPEKEIEEIVASRYVDIINFCVMPNHFHMTVHTKTDTGLSRYMHRISNAYAKYFNTKYERTGHVFQGTYKAKIIDTDQQLNYLSAYIHNNPHELSHWKNRAHTYPWSSFQDYQSNRWGQLLQPQIILDNVKSFTEYNDFVKESGAKQDFD